MVYTASSTSVLTSKMNYMHLHVSRPVFRIFSLRLFSGLLLLKSSLFVFKRCSLHICFLLESLIFLGLAESLFLRLLLGSLLSTLSRLFFGFTFFYCRFFSFFDVSSCVLLINSDRTSIQNTLILGINYFLKYDLSN